MPPLDAETLSPAISNAPVAWQPPTHGNSSYCSKRSWYRTTGTAGTEAINQAQRQNYYYKKQEMIARQITTSLFQTTPEQVPQDCTTSRSQKSNSLYLLKLLPTTPETPKAPTQTTPPPKTGKNREIVTPERPAAIMDMFNNTSIELMLPLNKKHCHLINSSKQVYKETSMYASMTAQLALWMWCKNRRGKSCGKILKMLNLKLVRRYSNLNTVNGTKPTILCKIQTEQEQKENKLESSFVNWLLITITEILLLF